MHVYIIISVVIQIIGDICMLLMVLVLMMRKWWLLYVFVFAGENMNIFGTRV